jgi:hypothetical protein
LHLYSCRLFPFLLLTLVRSTAWFGELPQWKEH